MWCLLYGAEVDTQDGYLRMVESTCIETIFKFCAAVKKMFEPNYLRVPNTAHTTQLVAPGTMVVKMFGSILFQRVKIVFELN